jgi:hypothetical protein
MRRVDKLTAWDVWQTDPLLGGARLAPLMGPDNVPAGSFSQAAVDRILALA